MDRTPRADPASLPRRRRFPHLASIALSVFIVLAATVAVAWVAIFAQPGVPPRNGDDVVAATTVSPDGSRSPEPEPTPADEPIGSCQQHTLAAPDSGRWVLYRAEYGTRSGHDYLRLRLRRDGGSDVSPSMLAEMIPAAQVGARHGRDVPGGSEQALVVRFDGPVRVPGQFGGRGRGVLGAFTISGAGDATYVVAAVNGSGCFEIDGGAWADGSAGDSTEITLLIERR